MLKFYGRGWENAFLQATSSLKDPAVMGKMVETLVACELRYRNRNGRLGYWQGKREIDFVGSELIEVKYREHVSIREFEWTKNVLPKGKKLTVLTKKDNATTDTVELIDVESWLIQNASIR